MNFSTSLILLLFIQSTFFKYITVNNQIQILLLENETALSQPLKLLIILSIS